MSKDILATLTTDELIEEISSRYPNLVIAGTRPALKTRDASDTFHNYFGCPQTVIGLCRTLSLYVEGAVIQQMSTTDEVESDELFLQDEEGDE